MVQRAHDAVIAVVEFRRKARQAVLAEIRRRFLAGLQGMQDAADLGRQDVAVARLFAQRRAYAQLAAAIAVEGGGVEIADAFVVARFGERHRLGVGNVGAEAAYRAPAQAEVRDFEFDLANYSPLEARHFASSLSTATV